MLQTKIPEPSTAGYKKNTRPNKFARSFSPTSNYLASLRFCCHRGGKESDTEIPFGKRFAQKYLLK